MGEKKKVLLVDNSEVILEILENALTKEGYNVSKAYDGMEGLQKVYANPPDIIFLDLIMPKIDGNRVCRYLKGDPKYRHIPIVILSGVASEAEKTIKTLGADAYIVKGRSDETISHVLTVLKGFEEGPAMEKPPIFGIERVTPRQLVMELLELKSHYDTILQSMAEGILETDSLGRITFANKEALKVLSMNEDRIIGMDIASFLDSGAVNSCLKKGSPKESHIDVRDNKTLKVNISPILQKKKAIGLLAIIEDITETEKLRKEIEETRRRLFLTEKLAATSKLAAGIAHEIKNPLNSLSFAVANLEHVITSSPGIKEAQSNSGEHIDLIRSDVERMRDLVDRFMSFARPREIQLAKKDVGAILRSAIKAIRLQAVSQKVMIVEEYAEGLPPVMVEEEELFRSFINLLTNSLEAMEKGGIIRISTSHSPEGILIKVTDTGVGIPKEIQDKVFDLFFTTKDKGSGLGLSQVHRTVETLGGKISITSPVSGGRGTDFSILIPVLQDQ